MEGLSCSLKKFLDSNLICCDDLETIKCELARYAFDYIVKSKKVFSFNAVWDLICILAKDYYFKE